MEILLILRAFRGFPEKYKIVSYFLNYILCILRILAHIKRSRVKIVLIFFKQLLYRSSHENSFNTLG